jgi:antitoxin component YwqK of YwqJK toxin-antitoxin module
MLSRLSCRIFPPIVMSLGAAASAFSAGCVDADSRPVAFAPPPAKDTSGVVVLPNGERVGPCPAGAVLRGYPAIPEAIATYCATEAQPSVRQGPFVSFYPSGKVLARGEYLHGNPHGQWQVFHENGQPLSSGAYALGIRDGQWTFSRADGQPILEEVLSGGKRASWVEYDYDRDRLQGFESFVAVPGKKALSNGKAGRRVNGGNMLVGAYQNDKADGVWEEKTDKGVVLVHLTMSAGFAEGGVEVSWPETRKVAAQGEMRKTLPQGAWTLSYPSGAKRAEARYEKGLLRALTAYHENGHRRLAGELLDGAPHATWTSYFPDGAVQTSGAYVRGLRQGMWRTADAGGKTVAEGLYESGLLVEGQSVEPLLWSSLGLGESLQGLFSDLGFITAGRGSVEVDQRVIGECMLFGDPASSCLSLDWENQRGAHEKDGAAEIERRDRQQDVACAMNDPAACARVGKRIEAAPPAGGDRKKTLAIVAGYYQKACDLSPLETAWKARDATGKGLYKGFHSAMACVWLGGMLSRGEVRSKAMAPADLYKRACDQEVAEGCTALAEVPAKKGSDAQGRGRTSRAEPR